MRRHTALGSSQLQLRGHNARSDHSRKLPAWLGNCVVAIAGHADPYLFGFICQPRAASRSATSIATKTLASGSLDDAVAAVAGYVARHIFARDCTVPPWSVSATDGADLAALLLARQVRGYPEKCRSSIRGA